MKIRQLARSLISSGYSHARRPLTRFRIQGYEKINLGAGADFREGWANIDIGGRRNLAWDLTKPLPLKAGQIRFVYSEHFIEHVCQKDAIKLLTNVRACMVDDGVIRLVTPDLRLFMEAYLAGELPPEWVEQTPTQMFNQVMRDWGHTFVYDEAELRLTLAAAGFTRFKRVERHESEHPELRRLERRISQLDLIVEARP